MTIAGKLDALRQEMAGRNIDVYIVGSADPHQSEYVAERWQGRAWLSGFSGSAGTLALSRDGAGLWVDSRYWLEADRVLAGTPITVFRLGQPDTPTIAAWIIAGHPSGGRVGCAADCTSLAQLRELEEALEGHPFRLEPGPDLLDAVWADRPARPDRPVLAYRPPWAEADARDQLARLSAWLRERDLAHFLVSALDEIAWLLNLRGSDVGYNPVFLAFLLAGVDGHTLFIESGRLDRQETERLAACGVSLAPHDALEAVLGGLPPGTGMLLPPATTSVAAALACRQLRHCLLASPVAAWKAVKTRGEQAALRRCLRRDGIALVKAFAWLGRELAAGRELDEHRFGAAVAEFRARGEDYRGESFAPIVAFGSNGAIVHYSAPARGSRTIADRGLLLVDTGGQYLDGTTDITRTLLVGGPATEAEKKVYSLVLRGHVRLAMARFPLGSNGLQLDTLARQPLWDAGLNYGHGTGHGVGFYLNVHEGPQRLAPSPAAAAVPLQAGHLLSDEPGCYLAGHFGVRIENLVLVAEDEACPGFLRFETMSLCPYEPALIDAALLDPAERAWIDAYHRRVREELSGGLEPDEVLWLEERTRSL